MLYVEQTYINAKIFKMQHISYMGGLGWEREMTHTFEIVVDDLNLMGEINLDSPGTPEISTNSAINMPLPSLKAIGSFLTKCAELYRDYGNITKLEIKKKPL
jgi:hypothetical protein